MDDCTMQEEIERLRNALARISLVSQRRDSPSSVLVDECWRIARAALAPIAHRPKV